MIQLYVDESYAFEYYCILLVKCQKIQSIQAYEQLEKQKHNLIQQLGKSFFDKVCSSDEFKKMIDVNSYTFDMVDKAKDNSVKASEVDRCSFIRKTAKDALQMKFFNTENAEVKIGYNSIEGR